MPPLDLIASEGVLSIGGNPNATFVFKGVTWHGTDLGPMVPSGLRVHSLDHYLAFLQSWGFNSIRLPFGWLLRRRGSLIGHLHLAAGPRSSKPRLRVGW